MPKLFTNNSSQSFSALDNTAQPTNLEILQNEEPITYQEYLDQRIVQEDVSAAYVDQHNAFFTQDVTVPLQISNPAVQMGEYFVIPVAELRQMLDSEDNPEFIHVYNGLKSDVTAYNAPLMKQSAILVPVKKVITASGEELHERCNSVKTFFIELFSCPPDRRCPRP